MVATLQNGLALKYIIDKMGTNIVISEENQIYDIFLSAAKQNGLSIKYIDIDIDEIEYYIMDYMLKDFNITQEYIDEKMYPIYLAAVTENGASLQYIENPTLELTNIALTNTKNVPQKENNYYCPKCDHCYYKRH